MSWKIVDGNPPYEDEFPQMYEVNETPSVLWRISEGNIPFRQAFPQMYTVTEAPNSLWKIVDGDLPFRQNFVDVFMYEYEPFTGIEKMRKGDVKVKGVHLEDTEVSLVCLGDFKVYKRPVDG